MPLIAALVAASVFFSLFEHSLKAVRKHRLHKDADHGAARAAGQKNIHHNRKAQRSHRLLQAVENQERYFMAARFWVIALRSSAAVFTGFTITREAAQHWAFLPVAAGTVAFILVILLLDALLPRIARHAPETIASTILPLFEIFALPLRPFFHLAQRIGEKLLTTFPPKPEQQGMTEDELRNALIEGEKSGIVESKEKTMVEGVFYLGDRHLGTFMTHRSDIQWLDVNAPQEDIRAKVLEYRSQRCFPVVDGTLDAIIGAAYPEDIILDLSESPAGLKAIMKKALFAPETMPALKAFESFKRGNTDFLFVMDEYGGFAGMVGLHDLMEEIVGELTAPVAGEAEEAVQQEDGSWLVDGGLNIDDAAELLALPELSATSGDYHTLAGFVLSLAGELPHSGDNFDYHGYRFTVLEMDGNRIDKIAVKKEVR